MCVRVRATTFTVTVPLELCAAVFSRVGDQGEGAGLGLARGRAARRLDGPTEPLRCVAVISLPSSCLLAFIRVYKAWILIILSSSVQMSTMEFKINYITPVRLGDTLLCTAKVVRAGKRSFVR